MTPIDDPGCDGEFARLLAEYDEALAQGGTPIPSVTPTDRELQQRLVEARECLALLEIAWPRQRKGSNGFSSDLARELGSTAGLRELGRFQVRGELGRGGHGVVFLAWDPLLRREVAVKVPRPEAMVTDDLRRRFQREAEAAARLNHPNLVPIHEAGQVGPLSYLVTAYCPGSSLAAWLRQQTALVPTAEAVQLLTALADAVAYMHGQGILHRDIKPGNILLQNADCRLQIADLKTQEGNTFKSAICNLQSPGSPTSVSPNSRKKGYSTRGLGRCSARRRTWPRSKPTAAWPPSGRILTCMPWAWSSMRS